jgi:acyl-CoA synthetase (AMP-forming)/AMP-acid ligase II/acyl carrier protein
LPRPSHELSQSSATKSFFWRRLEQFGDRIAVTTEAGLQVSYDELARKADAFASKLGGERRLLSIEASNDIEVLVAYLGALRGGHPVILAAAGGDPSRINAAFQPESRLGRSDDGAWTLTHERDPQGGLHPELALLLSTSGSTGEPKLVRLSASALDANADSIGEYLGLTPDQRAITSLPVHYSYGLSVVNSHLAVGATLLLTGGSVLDPAFWSFFDRERATSLAGVPYTYELLERVGFFERDPGALRTLTQAGGRLPPEMARRCAEWADDRGVRFYIMYGQTEATARMAYLPPEATLANPGVIGVAIPRGEFHLIDAQGRPVTGAGETGELVYRGPNIMMGYATTRADLARGPELDELRTGDLASRDAGGFYRIVGRMKRFAKLFGLRISLDDVEARLDSMGAAGAAVSDDKVIYVAMTRGPEPAQVARDLAVRYKLPEHAFCVVRWADLPTLESGKVDYARIRNAAAVPEPKASPVRASSRVADAFRAAFPQAEPQPQDSFVSLGGDSLNYVMLSITLEEHLGELPEDWEKKTIGELAKLARRQHPLRFWTPRVLETEVGIRMFAIIGVIIAHASWLPVWGGSEALMILAGYNLARYQKTRLGAGRGLQVAGSFFRRIIIPYYALMIVYALLKRGIDVPSLLLVSNFVGRFHTLLEPFWFLEAMLQGLLVVGLASLFKPVRRAMAADPWRFGLLWLATAVTVRVAVFAVFEPAELASRTPDVALCLLALGWCANEANSTPRKLFVTGALAALAVLQWGGVPHAWLSLSPTSAASHAAWLVACAFGLLWVRRVYLPSFLHRGVSAVAAASFYIYLTHVLTIWVLFWRLGVHILPLNIACSLAVGLAAWRLATRWGDRTSEGLRWSASPPQTPPSAPAAEAR